MPLEKALSDPGSSIFFIAIAGFVLLSFTKVGKALALGGKITRTLSESVTSRTSKAKSKVSIHLLSKKSFSGNIVGIEVSRSSGFSINQKLIALDKAELQALLKLLKEAEPLL